MTMHNSRSFASLWTTGLFLLCAAPWVSAQSVAIVGARVFPVSGAPIDNATVVIENGRITAVGANVTVPAGARRIEAAGKWVTPGFFDASSVLTLQEIGAVPDTRDYAARGRENIAASFRPWLGINPTSQYVVPS